MQNETPLKQDLQQEPASQTPMSSSQGGSASGRNDQGEQPAVQNPEPKAQDPKPKAQSSKGLLIVVIIFGFLLLVCGGVGGYLLWKNAKETSTDTEVEQSEEEATTKTTTTETTDDSTDSDTEDEAEKVDPYEGWKTYIDSEKLFTLRYQSSWSYNETTENVICFGENSNDFCVQKLDYFDSPYNQCRIEGTDPEDISYLEGIEIDGIKTYDSYKQKVWDESYTEGVMYKYCVENLNGEKLAFVFSVLADGSQSNLLETCNLILNSLEL